MPLPALSTIHLKFTTRAFSTGIATTLSGSPVVSIYKDGSTTESTTGVTLTVDFDARTGLNHVAVDTSTDAVFYTNGSRFYAVITTGTVGGVSAVGYVVGEFELVAAVTVPTAAQMATSVWQDLLASADFGTAGSIGALLKLDIDATISSRSTYAGSAPPTVAQIATAVWQDATAGDFTVASSIGKALYVANIVPGAAGGHFIAGANAATTVNITGTITTVTNLTNLPAIPANWLTAAGIAASALNGKGDWLTTAGYTVPPTVAQIATKVWQDTTASDFTVLTSPGSVIFGQLGGAFTTTSSSIFSAAALANAPTGGGGGPTAAAIATAVWQDVTPGDFTVIGSPGHTIVTQLHGAFSTTTSSVYSVAALANAPSGGGGGPTAAAIASAVWKDATAADFTVVGSIGQTLFTGIMPGQPGGFVVLGPNLGPMSIDGGVTFSNSSGNAFTLTAGGMNGAGLAATGAGAGDGIEAFGGSGGRGIHAIGGTGKEGILGTGNGNSAGIDWNLGTPRALDSVADASMMGNDAQWAAIGAGVGQHDAATTPGTMTIKTPATATLLRTYAVTTATAPATVPTKII